ncbi:hypothetical protein WJX84_011016 [Apatococcus fuscideae]|uniref:Uncharacterized protein n=1 Tax=Apatococcus fuscideae TaxID=2026836 RepID=A0AAW1SM74_9CHLO
MPVITVRPEVLEYGSVPIASWLPRLDNHAALQSLAHQLGQVAKRDESGRYMVDLTTLARTMEVPYQHAGVLVDMLEAVVHEHQDITRTPQGLSEPEAVDFHAVMIFLFAQLYVRQAQRPEAMEVWPQSQVQSTQGAMRHVAAMHAEQPASPRGLASHAAAAVSATNGPPVHHQLPLGSFSSPSPSHPDASPSGTPGAHLQHHSPGGASPTQEDGDLGGGSPGRLLRRWAALAWGACRPPPTRSSLSSGGTGHFQHGRSNALVRTELHLHLKQHQQLLHGYSDYICRSFPAILSLALNQPPPPGSSHRHVHWTSRSASFLKFAGQAVAVLGLRQ